MHKRENTADVRGGKIQWSKVSHAQGARFFRLVRIATGSVGREFKKSQRGNKFMDNKRQEAAS